MSTSRKLNIKCKTKNGQHTPASLTFQSTIHDLLSELSTFTGASASSMRILQGYPPAEIDLTQKSKLLSDIPVHSGDVLIIQEIDKAMGASETSEPSPSAGFDVVERMHTPANITGSPSARFDVVEQMNASANIAGLLMRQEVPSDNSCLFTSVHYVMSNGDFDTCAGTVLRKIIANTVSQDPITYTNAFLGKTNSEYCQWIQDEKTWGGAIEVSVLSKHYKIEIVVADTKSENLSYFGEDENYQNRVLLIYDGIHYDPLHMEIFNSDTSLIQTIFPCADNIILDRAKELLKEAKLSRQYTDVGSIRVKCNVCNEIFSGTKDANEHAIKTQHSEFDECK